jgi:hypothetical protein
MHIKKYDVNYGRRALLEKVALGIGTAGVLMPLWPLIANGADMSKAYPDELLSIELYTKGKLKPGDVVDANNVDYVKDLLDPIGYHEVKNMGRTFHLVAPTTEAAKLNPHDYLEATLRNKGQAAFDANNNVVRKSDGGPWIGGLPFSDPQNGLEAIADITLSWGRHNFSSYAIRDWDIGPDGNVAYQYDFVWSEMNATARVDDTVFQNHKDILRFQSVVFTAPQDTAGTSFLSTWPYDQRQFPELVGYLPAFRRLRQFPTNQRFEPLVPGITLFLSDGWASGDPMLTWGNYKIVERKPFLASVSKNWHGKNPNWDTPTNGGPKGHTFFDTWKELVPEVIVLQKEPIGYPRSPYGKALAYIDARNGNFVGYNTYDRRGQVWKSHEPAFSQYVDGDVTFKDAKGHPEWSWCSAQSHDVQANRMSRFYHAKELPAGPKSIWGTPDTESQYYQQWLTAQAMTRLGSA